MGDLLDLATADDWAKTRKEVDRGGMVRNILRTLIKNRQVSKHGKDYAITREGGLALRATLRATAKEAPAKKAPRKRAERKVTRKRAARATSAGSGSKFVVIVCADAGQLAEALRLVAKGGAQ